MAFEMSTESLRKHCRKLNLYSSRLDLNDILHLQCKGITKIQGLEEFTGLTTLYLESNAISDVEGLDHLKKLTSLYMAKNFLSRTVGLDILQNLQVLDLADNNISKIESFASLKSLKTLNISGNKLSSLESIRELKNLPELISLDLSNNRIQSSAPSTSSGDRESEEEEKDEVVSFLCTLNLKWLRLVGNPFIRKVKGYRRIFIGNMLTLNYFDDMPAFPRDRRLALAWLRGGIQAEREERRKINEEETAKRNARAKEFSQMVADAKERAKTNPVAHDPSIFRLPVQPPQTQEQGEQHVEEQEDEKVESDSEKKVEELENQDQDEVQDEDIEKDAALAGTESDASATSNLESHPLTVETLSSEEEEEEEDEEDEEDEISHPYTVSLQSHLRDINSLDREELRERQAKHRSEILQREFNRANLSIQSRSRTNQESPSGPYTRPVIWGTDRYKQLWASAASIPDPEPEEEEALNEEEDGHQIEQQQDESVEDPDSIGAQYRALLNEGEQYEGSSDSESSFDPMDEFTVTNDDVDRNKKEEDSPPRVESAALAVDDDTCDESESSGEGIEVIEREPSDIDFEAMD